MLLCNIEFCIAQPDDQCLAVITGVTGDVLVKKTNSDEFVKAYWGTQLYKGDKVKTISDAEATLSFSDNSVVRLGANSMMTISTGGSSTSDTGNDVKKVSTAMLVNIAPLISRGERTREEGALAGLRGDNNQDLIALTSPSNTFVKTNRPSFSWTASKTFDNYTVNLYSSSGLIWSKRVKGNSLEYPGDIANLEFGQSYFWNVEGEDLIEDKKSDNHKFSVLSADKSAEVSEQEEMIRDTFTGENEKSSLHSFLGLYYINQGLLQDAISEFQIVSGMNPDAPLAHEILGSLYSDIGQKDKAIDELQKALALSKKNEDK